MQREEEKAFAGRERELVERWGRQRENFRGHPMHELEMRSLQWSLLCLLSFAIQSKGKRRKMNSN